MGCNEIIYTGEKYSFRKTGETIGHGGNSKVFEIELLDTTVKDQYVAKFFSCTDDRFEERYSRFCREVEFLESNHNIPGIMSLLDKHCPNILNKGDDAWYLIPKAQRYHTKPKVKRSLRNILIHMLELAHTIQQLHEKNAAHRDIKPENILLYNNRLHLIDYGLLWIKGEERLTVNEERIGPYKILPPELTSVIPQNDSIDFCCSDVYLFAKVLWMYINHNNEGFSGPYLRNREFVYMLQNHYAKETTTLEPLHQLFENSTLDDWQKRISIKDCIELMQLQLNIIQHNDSQDPYWKRKIKDLIYDEKTKYIIAYNEPVAKEYSDIVIVLKMLSSILEQSEAVIKQSFTNRTISEIILFSSVIPVHNKQIILHSRGSKDTAQYRLSSVTMRYFPQSEIIELIPGTPTENRIEGEIYYQQRRDLDPQPGLKKYLLTPNEKIVFSKGGTHESF